VTRVQPNKPLKLTAAGLSRANAMLNADRGSIVRGRSLAAIRWAAWAEALARRTTDALNAARLPCGVCRPLGAAARTASYSLETKGSSHPTFTCNAIAPSPSSGYPPLR